MGPVDIIVIAVIVAVLGLAGWYVYREKKKGKKCIGCPAGGCESCSCSCKK